MTFSRITLNTMLGGLIIAAVLALSIGPIFAGQLFVMSIICTLGIGGVFWGMLAFGVGLLITTVWEAIRGDHAPSHPSSDPQAEALTTYVSKALQAGANNDQLLHRLQRQGWTEDEIIQAIQHVQSDPEAPDAPGAA
ncbi:MAG: hypothetical protein RLZZ597_2626 [Cyanobacteriota bacterium]|jgi:hypothetical protein